VKKFCIPITVVNMFPNMNKHTGLAVVSFGFNGILSIDCTGDKTIFPTQESINMFSKFFVEEMDILTKNMI